jgi:hypothetical protein
MAALALGLLGAAPTIIQGISSIVHGIEHLFGKGNGAAKKQAVLTAFNSGVDAYNAVASAATGLKLPSISGDAEKALGNLVDAIVSFYNAIGIFQHGTQPPVAQ